jgi:serine/threonine protein kinase
MGFAYNVGSPKYMPPESLKFNRYSFKSDVWSMGIMAYELVYGDAPWKSKDDAKLFELMTTVPIESLFGSNAPVSNHYRAFIISCLQPNITQRAGPEFIFSYTWPFATDFIYGYE